MARAAAYGNIQPEEYLGLDFDDGLELARRVTELYRDDKGAEMEVHMEVAKALLKSNAELAKVIARSGI